jgi:hypothetical protein
MYVVVQTDSCFFPPKNWLKLRFRHGAIIGACALFKSRMAMCWEKQGASSFGARYARNLLLKAQAA